MKLWLIEQNEVSDYDTFDSAVVAAETEDEARNTHPYAYAMADKDWDTGCWASCPANVWVTYLGEAASEVEKGIICASFNAG